jgi:exosortase
MEQKKSLDFLKMSMGTYLKFGLLICLVLFLYFPDITSMVSDWASKKEYSHGFLIPLISAYIIWTQRAALRLSPMQPDVKGIFILIIGIALLILGNVAFEPYTRRFSLIITMLGLIYFLGGIKIGRILLFPVGYLVFMIPIPYIIMKTIAVNLRLISAKITFFTLNLIGIPIVREGVNLELPNISLEVADLCTGILSIVAITALSVLYAYFTQRHLLSKIALVVFSIPIAIFSNMFRLMVTVGLAYAFGEKVLGSVVHQFHGTFNFLITIALLVLLGSLIRKIDLALSTVKSS